MEQSKYLQYAKQMIGLTQCAVNGETPDAALLDIPEPDALFSVCQSHDLTACTAYALESAGVRLPAFTEAKEKAIRKNILLDAERKKILAELEAAGIWYLLLKGVLLKDMYPKLGMRQMSDNDILFDETRREDVRTIMESLGFSCEHYGTGYNDAYAKPPVCFFEMHSHLLSEAKNPEFYAYYKDLSRRLLPDAETGFGRHFSQEDFYLFITVHAYKHYASGGTGVRSLLDTYVFMQKYGSVLDREYLDRELETLGIKEYELESRTVAKKLFSGQTLSEAEEKTLQYFILSGTYGNPVHMTENRLKNAGGSKIRYILKRVFPSMDYVRVYFPFFYRHKILLPVLWIWRPVRALFRNRKMLFSEIRALFRSKNR